MCCRVFGCLVLLFSLTISIKVSGVWEEKEQRKEVCVMLSYLGIIVEYHCFIKKKTFEYCLCITCVMVDTEMSGNDSAFMDLKVQQLRT